MPCTSVTELVARPKAYDEAVALLADLRDLEAGEGKRRSLAVVSGAQRAAVALASMGRYPGGQEPG